MGSLPKKIYKAAVKKPLKFVEKKVAKPVLKAGGEVFEELVEKPFKKVSEEVIDTTLGIDKNDRRGTNDRPTQSKAPAPSKVKPETTTAQRVAQGGLSTAEQRKLLQKNKAFKQTQV